MKLFFRSLFISVITTIAYGQNVFPTGVGTSVGIGTDNPSEKLQVVGVAKVSNLHITNPATSGTSFTNFNEWHNNSLVLSAGFEMNNGAIGKHRMLNFYDLQGWAGSNGIMPNDDYFALEVLDRNNLARFYFEGHKGGGNSNGRSSFVINNKAGSEVFKVIDDGNNNIALQMGQENSRVVIGGYSDYEPSHKLVIKNGSALVQGNLISTSNVGIGTNSFIDGSDTYRLSVDGAIRADRVRVYTNWADYVFENDYRLPTLTEVEKHIKEKGHLINIPSAKQVKDEGIDLGEMNKLLLEKVEELTLYLIDMQKEINMLKNQIQK